MSAFKDILDPNEQVLWTGKPKKKSFMLPAFGGTPFTLTFLLAFIFLLYFEVPGSTIFELFGLVFALSLLLGFIVFLIVVAPIGQYKELTHTEYMITNQRLIIKKGIREHESWFVNLEEIMDVIVKIGLVDKLFGTGKIYPITPEYPYEPKIYVYSKDMDRLKRVYNIVKQEYEEIPERELTMKTHYHPHLEGLKEPYAVQKFLREVIVGAGTNFVNCEYCNFRYDLNKEGKCPHCGGPHPQNYSL